MVHQKKFFHAETQIYLIVWVSAVFYAIYHFTAVSRTYFQHYHDTFADFSSGLSITNFHKRDKADFEWETIIYFLKTVYPSMIFYLVVSEMIIYLKLETKHQKYFRTFFPIFYLTHCMGYKVTLITVFQPIVFSLASSFKSKGLIWICNLVSLALIAMYKEMNANEQFLKGLGIDHFEAYMCILLLCWLNLKCTSYYLNCTSNTSFLDFLSYCFYFPTLFTGPFLPYEDFKKCYGDTRNFENLDLRIKRLGLNMFRCAFWFAFAHISLHFVYVNATSFQIELVEKLDLCTLCGYGYLMGQFFHIKYVVLYGLSTSLASFEKIPVPTLPRCIGRVHLYSDMWKYFDPGLYKFLKACVFIPSQNLGANKFLSSFLCFFFVYIWHGIEDYILIWATLNLLGVTLESLGNAVYEEILTKVECIKDLGANDLRRIKCVLAAPLLAMSSVSNFYFFAGREVGDIFVKKSLGDSSFNKLILLLTLYCCCQVSTELRDVDAHGMSPMEDVKEAGSLKNRR